MTGSATYAASAHTATMARERLDRAAELAALVEGAQREMLGSLVELWPTSAWLAAGVTSAKKWLLAYTRCSEQEAHRLERLAGLCHRHPDLANVVRSGALSLARAHALAQAANADREPWLADSLPAFVRLNERGLMTVIGRRRCATGPAWSTRSGTCAASRPTTWCCPSGCSGVGRSTATCPPTPSSTSRRRWTRGPTTPTPKTPPNRRSLGERRADALDDVCRASLDPESTRWGASGDDVDDDEGEWEDLEAEDTFDGFCPTDDLDEDLTTLTDHEHPATTTVDPLVLVRRRLRRAEAHRRRRVRRRTRSRSGVCVNVHVDLRTLADLRDAEDLEDLVLRGDGWNLTRAAAEHLLCDSALVATLFDAKGTLLDAHDAAEQWSRKQRRAITARDAGCVFPGCGRPRHCDIHHLHHRGRGGPTRTSNGAMLCRFHHRLLHHHGWHLTVHDGHWTAIDPHGTHWTGRPTPLPTTRGDPP